MPQGGGPRHLMSNRPLHDEGIMSCAADSPPP
jgi:hypothetical protein